MTHFERIAEMNKSRGQRGYEGGGLGYTFWDLQKSSNMEQCDIYDLACNSRNNERTAEAVDVWMGVNSNPATAYAVMPTVQFNVNTPTPNVVINDGPAITVKQIESSPNYGTPAQYFTPAPVAPAASVYNPIISFVASQFGNIFYPGDTWSISIVGGKPGAAVAADNNPFGVIGNDGKWSKSGTFATGDIGTWNEHWTVGGVAVGTWAFTVGVKTSQTPNSNPTGGGSNTTNNNPYSGNTTSPLLNENQASSASALGSDWVKWFEKELIPGVPNYMLIAGVAVVGGIMFKGGRK